MGSPPLTRKAANRDLGTKSAQNVPKLRLIDHFGGLKGRDPFARPLVHLLPAVQHFGDVERENLDRCGRRCPVIMALVIMIDADGRVRNRPDRPRFLIRFDRSGARSVHTAHEIALGNHPSARIPAGDQQDLEAAIGFAMAKGGDLANGGGLPVAKRGRRKSGDPGWSRR